MQLTPNERVAFLTFLSSVYTKLINVVISRWHQFQLVALLFMLLEKQNRYVIVTVVAMTADLHRHRY